MFSEIKLRLKKLINSDEKILDQENKLASDAILNLFVEAAAIDGEISKLEKEKILFFLTQKFQFSVSEAKKKLKKAILQSNDQIEIWSKTKSIRSEMTYDERLEIIEMIWQIVLIDEKVDDFESQLMRRLAGLLFIEDKDSGIAKQRAKEKL